MWTVGGTSRSARSASPTANRAVDPTARFVIGNTLNFVDTCVCQDLASGYTAAGGRARPAKTSVVTYIIVHERERGLITG